MCDTKQIYSGRGYSSTSNEMMNSFLCYFRSYKLTLLDENIALKMIEELEARKEHQQRAFMAMMKVQKKRKAERMGARTARKSVKNNGKECIISKFQTEMAVNERKVFAWAIIK